MGTDLTQAGLPFVYSTPTVGSTHPTCRAVSLSELTGGGPITVLATSPADVGNGIVGLIAASLDSEQRVSLLALDDETRDDEGASEPCTVRLSFSDGQAQRLSWLSLHRPDGTPRSHDVTRAANQVIEAFEREGLATLFVAAVPVPSAPHRFLDLVARRVVASRDDATCCWYFAARRDAHPGAAHLLHSDGVVRTFDTRRWTEGRQHRLPERFWRQDDVSALSSVSESGLETV